MTHNIPLRSVIKLFKHINWENSATLRETWKIKGVKQWWGEYDSLRYTHVNRKDTIGFFPAHDLRLSSGLSTTLYGMYAMKKGRVQVIRHTLTPNVNFSYEPAINKHLYSSYQDLSGEEVIYSYVDGAPRYRTSGKINFSINNRLEMKVRSKKEDEPSRKITLLESLSISTGYDLLADSLNWDYLNISGRTIVFKQINVGFRMAFDPYAIGENGSRMKKTELVKNDRLLRMSSTGTDISFGYNINNSLFNKKEEKEKKESPSGFANWNLNVSYIFSYNMYDNRNFYIHPDSLIKYNRDINNSISVNGNFDLTPKWKLGVQSGYNFTQKSMVISEFRIERDLHCWLINFKWVPFGNYRRFEFEIRAKASILQDAKLPQRREYID